MSTPEPPTPSASEHLCGYQVRSWLTAQNTALCVTDGGRLLILKTLPEECLPGGQLHPSVRDRLMRVKELAHRQVANFIGVERQDGGKAYLVWEYVEGISFAEYLAGVCRTSREMLLMLRELILATEGLHALGLIHGSLHPQNVIIRPTNELVLTHISPLLHHEPQVDCDAVGSLLLQAIRARGEGDTRLGRLLGDHVLRGMPMLALAGEISRLVESPEEGGALPVEDPAVEGRFRRKALYSAAGCAGAAAAAALAAYLLLQSSVDAPQRPPEAPAALLQPR